MKPRFVMALIILCAAVAGLLSCSGDIYSTIETDIQTIDNSIPNTVWIYDVAKAGGSYYVAAGGIYQGTWNPTSKKFDWKPTDTSWPFNPSGESCNALAAFGAATWGGFINASGKVGLRQSDASFSFQSGTPGLVPGIMTGKQIYSLQVVNNVLFAVALDASGAVWELDYTTDGSTWNASTLAPGISAPFTAIAWDATRSKYWATSGTSIYVSPTNDPSSFTQLTTPPSPLAAGDYFRGILVGSGTDAGWLFVPTKLDGIYYSTDGGGNWTKVPAPLEGSATVGFLSIGGPVDPTASASPGSKYLLGSDNYGYYVLDLSQPTSAQLSRMSYNTIDLYSQSVRKIYIDGSTVFMGTNGKGLWSASFDPKSGDLASGTAWTNE
jgi:hypothetical protein